MCFLHRVKLPRISYNEKAFEKEAWEFIRNKALDYAAEECIVRPSVSGKPVDHMRVIMETIATEIRVRAPKSEGVDIRYETEDEDTTSRKRR